jgi:hypothetical protein
MAQMCVDACDVDACAIGLPACASPSQPQRPPGVRPAARARAGGLGAAEPSSGPDTSTAPAPPPCSSKDCPKDNPICLNGSEGLVQAPGASSGGDPGADAKGSGL